jgi:hypothetical protein
MGPHPGDAGYLEDILVVSHVIINVERYEVSFITRGPIFIGTPKVSSDGRCIDGRG